MKWLTVSRVSRPAVSAQQPLAQQLQISYQNLLVPLSGTFSATSSPGYIVFHILKVFNFGILISLVSAFFNSKSCMTFLPSMSTDANRVKFELFYPHLGRGACFVYLVMNLEWFTVKPSACSCPLHSMHFMSKLQIHQCWMNMFASLQKGWRGEKDCMQQASPLHFSDEKVIWRLFD